MAENNTPNDNGRDNPRQTRIEKLQLRRLLRQERENRELRRQLTTILNAQRELERRVENSSKDSDAINQEILKNNTAIDKLIRENQKYEKSLQNAQDKLDEEQSDFYRMALQDNNVELQRLKELNAELRSGNRTTEERLEDLTEAMEEMPDSFNENLRDVLRDLNLNSLTDQSKDTSEHITEAVNKFGFSQEQTNQLLGDLIKQSSDFNSKYKNILSDDDWISAMDTFYDAGVKDLDRITELAESIALANNFGVDLSNAQNLLQYGTKDDVNNVLSGLLQAQQIQGITDDELSSITEGFESIMMQTKDMSQEDRKATIDKYMSAVTTLYANNMGDVAQALTENLQDIATGDIGTLTDKYGGSIPSLILNGDMQGLIDMYTGHIGMTKHEKPLLAQYGVSDEAMNQLIQSPITRDDFNASMSELMSQDDSEVISDRIESFKVGVFDRIKNTLAPASLKVSDTLGDLGIDWNDVENIYYLLQLAKPAWSVLTGLFGKITSAGGLTSWVKSLLTGGTGATVAGGASASTAGAAGAVGATGAASTLGTIGIGAAITTGIASIGNALDDKMVGLFGTKAQKEAKKAGVYDQVHDEEGVMKKMFNALTFRGVLWDKDYLEEKEQKYIDAVDNAKLNTDLLQSIDDTLKGQNKVTSSSQFSSFNSHRNGLDNVPIDGYKAVLHSGEAVLTRDEAQKYRANPNILNHSEKDLEVFSKNAEAMNRNEAFAQRTLSILDKIKSKEVLGKARETAQGVYDRLKASQISPSTPGDSPNVNPINGPSIIGDDFIGAYTVKHETGSAGLDGGGMVSSGKNDPLGGISYGIPQYSTKQGSAKSFRDWLVSNYPEYNQYLGGKTPGTAAFGQGWKDAYAKFGHEFSKLQLKYNYSIGYDKWVQGSLKNYGIDFNKNRAFQEVAYSMSTQHGPAGYKKYLRGLSSNMSDTEFLKQLYNNRINRAAVPTTKRWKQELQEMLALVNQPALAYEQGTPYVPTDQIALLHKGEMVVPKDQNPMNSGKVISSSDDEMLAKVDKFMQLVQWGFEFIGKKQGEEKIVQQSTGARKLDTLNDRYQNRKLGR